MNRKRTFILSLILIAIFIVVMIAGYFITDDMLMTDLSQTFKSPSPGAVFGTDNVGRDMFLRTIKGLSLSVRVGMVCSVVSVIIAVIAGIMGPALGGVADAFIGWMVDLVLSVPHTILIILISIAFGGGLPGICAGVIMTHWTSLTRIIRVEVMQIKEADYTKLSQKLGKSPLYIAKEHFVPHIVPQIVVGAVLLFPHAILHESAITFLGFGLPSHEPAIGIILAESMKYLTLGYWWLAFFPGVCLISISFMTDRIGKNIEKLMNVTTAHE